MAPAWSWMLVLAALTISSAALAQPADVDQLADKLAHAKDFRVRTQAALASWVARGVAFVASLPAKKPRKQKPKVRRSPLT